MLLPSNERYAIHCGDCIPHQLDDMPAHSVDCMITSVPFPSLYSYTSKTEDVGNSEDLRSEAKLHLGYFYRGLARVLKPGRVAIVHVMQIPRMKRAGESGLHDFRGMNIRLGERAGLIFEYDWLVSKNPQSQALRTKSHCLQFAGLERDRARSRGSLPDYLIKFMAPGENTTPIDSAGQVGRNDWIQWAEAAWPWTDIRETDTLNTKEAKGEEDTKHICPLQLGVINRLVRLYSNPDEIVYDPFLGVGSTGYMALKLGRRAYGCEIKDEYIEAARRNLAKAAGLQADESPLFAFAAEACE